MLTVEEALGAVLAEARGLETEECPAAQAGGRVLAQAVVADGDSPPFDKALMDGFAVASGMLGNEELHQLVIVGEITAGRVADRALAPGETLAIMTGAPMPSGADAVVPHEITERAGAVLRFEAAVRPGQNVLPRGREMRAGQTVLTEGTMLNGPALGVLAAVGRQHIRVARVPRVAIVATGDELVEPGQVPGPGQIRETNRVVLAELVATAGGMARVESRIASDESRALEATLRPWLQPGAADLLLLTGGVSAGKLDLVPGVLEGLGVERVFHKVRLKPGKPLWFGVKAHHDGRRSLVFGLPGNPVSTVVGFLLFVRPALEMLAGRAARRDPTEPAVLEVDWTHRGDRPTYHPARVVGERPGDVRVEPLAWAGSADLLTVARSDGFVHFPAGDARYAAGSPARFLRLPVSRPGAAPTPP